VNDHVTVAESRPQGAPANGEVLASVLIATTGGGRLEDIVRTYLGNPTARLEVIVIVDNPAVGRAAFLAPFRSDGRLKVAFNDANIGLTRSLNSGLMACCGDLILRNDDDDLPHPDRVARTVAFFREHPDCDLAYSFARGIDAPSGRSWTIAGPTLDADIKAQLLRRNFIVHSSLAFRAGPLKALGGYDATFRYAQDYDLYLRSIRAGLSFGCIPEVLVERYYHGNAITVERRRTQLLCAFATRLVHEAEIGANRANWRMIFRYLRLLALPDALRSLRRRLGHGR
jgi:glycosyltransferase involved in cell wall biosynthesis